MRTLPNRLLLLGAASTLSVVAPSVRAQGLADTNPPLPNILLIVDTSGSMERKSASQDPPQCDPTGVSPSERSRWIETIEVLTGSIQNYRCQALARNSTSFRNEYSLDGNLPYDFNYVNAYHRPLSGTCTPGPGVLPSPNAYDYPAGAVGYHDYSNLATPCTTFTQTADGILDSYGQFMRFGLMTFDTLPHKGTGVSGTSSQFLNGIQGTWSYFLNSASGAGRPEACSTAFDLEVGARNAAAPPWEGRMVAFGNPAAGSAAVVGRNTQIQEILLATRPFGATPIAGIMQDAKDFLWNDASTDPLNGALKFGPKDDPFILKGCRQQAIVLLTDGEPNLDLRPSCEGPGPPAGQCPYEKPETTAETLATSSNPPPVKTYVVGFALSQVTVGSVTKDCNNFTTDDLTGVTGLCNDIANKDNVNLQACCTLNRIAFKGGTTKASFATDKNALGVALSKILGSFATTTTRTLPSFATASTASDSKGFRFFSSFNPVSAASQLVQLPDGQLDRQRYTCDDPSALGKPKAVKIDPDAGDSFAANLNAQSADNRVFISVKDDAALGKAGHSLRPSLTTDVDGLASYSGAQYSGTSASFVSSTPFAAMGLTSGVGDCAGLADAECRDRILKWLVGLDNGSGTYHRCKTPGTDCHLLGEILHSTPTAVNRPLALVRDESYSKFADAKAKRPLVLYVSTNDGILHAFRVASNERELTAPFNEVAPVNSRANNEMWAFIPPAVLPQLQGQYPPQRQVLLDGTAVVKDVVATKQADGSYTLERTAADAEAGSGDWRTVLVQSFGPGATVSGYFALDITEPTISNTTGPKFLWQLTLAGDGSKLFGPSAAKPLITTVFFDDSGDGKAEEVPVAVLPGGDADAASSGTCARAATPTNIDTNFPARTTVRCYPSPQPGRSLTIVRLDNGKIIRTFRREVTDRPATLPAGRVITADLDAPIVGEPVAFPSTPGASADRIFVGDKEGGLWKVDLTSPNPSNWTMKLFFDAFPGGTLAHTASDGQPLSTPPVLSVDDVGNVTVHFSTGDQEVFTYTSGVKNYLWSLTDKLNSAGTAFESKVNWYQTFNNGERVTGPLSLFNRNLYFSSFLPDDGSGGECSLGKAYVWGMNYVVPDPVNAAGSGGKDALQVAKGPPAVIADKLDVSTSLTNSTRTSIFGVGVAQEPTCFDEATSSSESFLGFGSHTSATNVQTGKFQLIVQTGAGGTKIDGGNTNAQVIDLPTPALRSVIDSWAAIVE
ncbi:MAG: PilC/PilY family type IV pilus protein [Polyangiaceae bacterium]|nr:PilC/PilY family type IV pilus protein [Polyangiaceae bacterium]